MRLEKVIYCDFIENAAQYLQNVHVASGSTGKSDGDDGKCSALRQPTAPVATPFYRPAAPQKSRGPILSPADLEREWVRDVGGDTHATEMTFAQFFNSVFEMLDQWCVGHSRPLLCVVVARPLHALRVLVLRSAAVSFVVCRAGWNGARRRQTRCCVWIHG